jgi:hypothetical protein
VHVEKNQIDAEVKGKAIGKIVNARLDIQGKATHEANKGDFNHPDLYHLAVLVEKAA